MFPEQQEKGLINSRCNYIPEASQISVQSKKGVGNLLVHLIDIMRAS